MTTDRKRIILQAFQDVLQELNNLHDHVATYKTEQYIHLEDLINTYVEDERVKKLFSMRIDKAPIKEIDELSNWLNIKENDNR